LYILRGCGSCGCACVRVGRAGLGVSVGLGVGRAGVRLSKDVCRARVLVGVGVGCEGMVVVVADACHLIVGCVGVGRVVVGMSRVGQNRINALYMTVYTPFNPCQKDRVYTIYIWFWPTLGVGVCVGRGGVGVGIGLCIRKTCEALDKKNVSSCDLVQFSFCWRCAIALRQLRLPS
jgi:hypothetical protein